MRLYSSYCALWCFFGLFYQKKASGHFLKNLMDTLRIIFLIPFIDYKFGNLKPYTTKLLIISDEQFFFLDFVAFIAKLICNIELFYFKTLIKIFYEIISM